MIRRLPRRAALVIGRDRAFGSEIVEALNGQGFVIAEDQTTVPDVLDLLVVNAPPQPRQIRFRDMTDDDFLSPLEQQLFEFVAAVQFAAPRLASGGSIVLVTSKAHLGTWDGVEIAASGAACVAMARSMALELGGQGVRVNTVAPDFVGRAWDTAISRKALAETVAWLASPASMLISGETILLDEGRSLYMALAAKR